jgi:hypothetical protein
MDKTFNKILDNEKLEYIGPIEREMEYEDFQTQEFETILNRYRKEIFYLKHQNY